MLYSALNRRPAGEEALLGDVARSAGCVSAQPTSVPQCYGGKGVHPERCCRAPRLRASQAGPLLQQGSWPNGPVAAGGADTPAQCQPPRLVIPGIFCASSGAGPLLGGGELRRKCGRTQRPDPHPHEESVARRTRAANWIARRLDAGSTCPLLWRSTLGYGQVEGAQVVAEDRDRKRLARLRSMDETGTHKEACRALRQIHEAGKFSPDHILIRGGFARLSQPLDTEVYSDRRVPERPVRPPATRLLRSRGCTLQFFLTALFEAQCRTRPGRVAADNTRPLKQGCGPSQLGRPRRARRRYRSHSLQAPGNQRPRPACAASPPGIADPGRQRCPAGRVHQVQA